MQRRDWNKIKKLPNATFESVASPTSDEYDLLATSILDFVELVFSLEEEGKFPSYESAKLLLEDNEKLCHYSHKIPEVDGALKLATPSDDNDFSRENIVVPFESNYDANNATIDVPLQHDLAADKTLEILLSYSESLAENTLKNKNNEEEDFPPIMDKLSPYLLGDGNPVWGIYKLLRKNGGQYKRRMPAYFGGFHLVLETHKKRGSLFGDSHLCDIFRKWRKSDKQLEWVMDPGDPTQVNEEMMMYHLGEYAHEDLNQKMILILTFYSVSLFSSKFYYK